MIDLGFYERVVSIKSQTKNRVRRIGVAVACGLALVVWLIASIVLGAGAVACVLVSVLIAAVPFVVSSFTGTELEISLSADHVSLSMIYGGKRRKEIFYAEPEDIVLISPNTPENLAKAEAFEPKQRFTAISKTRTEEVKEWIVVFADDKENHYLFIFEAEDGVQKLLKMLKPSTFSNR